MSRASSSSLSRTNTALRSSSAIIVIRSFAALNTASSRSTFTSRSAQEHSTPPPALGYWDAHDPLPGPHAIFFSQPILFHDRLVRHPQCPAKLSFAALPELPALPPHEILSHAEEPS